MLKDARDNAGISLAAAVKEIEKTPGTLSRVETGKVAIRVIEVRALCDLYGVDAETAKIMTELASRTKTPVKGWWEEYGEVPEYLGLYVGLESEARRIDAYQPDLVPGLLQTGDYARALIRGGVSDPDEAARLVRLRLDRQIILSRQIDPPLLRVALRETVLRTPVGGRDVMAAQLASLAEAAELPNVTIRVVPFEAGFHPGITSGPFSVLRFALTAHGEDREPPTVYSDLYTGGMYLDKPADVARYDQAFHKVWTAALDEDSSAAAIREASEGMRHG